MLRAGVAMLSVRPVVGVDAVTLLTADGGEAVLGEGDYRLTIGRDGAGRLTPLAAGTATGTGAGLRVLYRAGLAADSNDVPEALRQGIVRLVHHLHAASDGGESGGAHACTLCTNTQT